MNRARVIHRSIPIVTGVALAVVLVLITSQQAEGDAGAVG